MDKHSGGVLAGWLQEVREEYGRDAVDTAWTDLMELWDICDGMPNDDDVREAMGWHHCVPLCDQEGPTFDDALWASLHGRG